MKIWFKQLSRLAQIAVIVVALHLVCLTVWSIDYLWHRATTTRHKIAINMVRIEPPAKPAPKPVANRSANKPTEAKKAVPKAAKPKPALPTPKPQQNALLQEIATHLEAISAPSKTPTAKSEVHIPVLATPQASTTSSGSEETIAQFLQESLTLPEFGEVRASSCRSIERADSDRPKFCTQKVKKMPPS